MSCERIVAIYIRGNGTRYAMRERILAIYIEEMVRGMP
jgi:hypothetical protein